MPVEYACPPNKDLSAYLLGRLPHASMASVADHLERCSTCQTAIETFGELPDPLLVELRQWADAGLAAIGPVDREQLAQAAALRGPTPEPAPERVAAYRLGEKLGHGGMGAVYRATHVSLGKTVAIKLLARERMADRGAQARFHREIRAVGQLRHVNIVNATDAGEAEGWHYLVMEHGDGWDLSRLVRKLGPLPIADACEIIRQAALALQHVQDNRLVHRDVKPSNLMLARDGSVKLLDLGLAVLLRDDVSSQLDAERDLTQEQQILGTLEYMAPEQLRNSRTVDVRADLYGLGGTLFKLLTGGSPFQARGEQVSPLQLAAHHLHTPAPEVRTLRPEVPAELAALVARLLAKRPEDRFASPRELAEQLAPLAKRADLTELATRAAVAVAGGAGAAENSRTSTFVHLSSAMSETDTRPMAAPMVKSPAVQPAMQINVERRSPRRAWLVALGFLGVAILATVILYIRDTRIEVPDGSRVEIARDGAVHIIPSDGPPPKAEGSPPRSTNSKPPSSIADLQLPIVRTAAGAPLGRQALVSRPAKIKGVDSWSLQTLGHSGDILAVAISPDSKLLATAGTDTAIRIWNVEDGTLHSLLLGHGDGVRHLLWSRDSRRLVSCDYKLCYLWEVDYGTRRWLHDVKSDTVPEYAGIGWGAEPHHLIAAYGVNRYETLDITSGKSLATFHANDGAFHPGPPVFSPDGRSIAVGDRTQVYVLDAATGKRLNAMPANSHSVHLAWSHDSSRLAIGLELGIVTVWEARGKRPLLTLGEEYPSPWVRGVGWSHDDSIVFAHGHINSQAWDAESGAPVKYPARDTAYYHVCASADGKFVAASHRSALQVFTHDTKLLWSQAGHGIGLYASNWSPQGEHIAQWWVDAKNGNWQLCILRASDGVVLSRRTITPLDSRWTPDGQELAVAQDGGDVHFFGITGDEPRRTLATGHKGPYQIRFAPDGKRLATGDQHRTVKMWTLGKDKPDHIIEGHQGDIRIEWSPNSQMLAVAGHNEPTTMVYDAEAKLVARCTNTANAETALIVWSPDSSALATCGAHLAGLTVFDAATGEAVQQIDARPGGSGVVWPHSERLAVIDHGHTCRWWNFEAGLFEEPLPSYGTDSNGAPVAPDRRTIAAPQGFGALFVWDFTTGERHGALVGLRNQQSVLVDPTGHYRLSHPTVAGELRIVAEIDGAQQHFTLASFAKRSGWKNDPGAAKLAPERACKPPQEGRP